MALDPRYIPLTTIWQLFTDKDTGEFLRNGYVKFWVDTARTVGKPVYQITGSPPNYTYIVYGALDSDGSWIVDLNDQGALDFIPYGFPYDDNGNIELYFMKAYSADDVEQFSREGIPNVTGSSNTTTEVDVNYVSNPQFLLHLDLPESDTKQPGEVRSAITDIAWGGWTYERPSLSTAKDFITFDRFGSDVTIPEKSPRYSLRVRCENPSSGDTFKDIRLKINDVNKFTSGTDYFTYGFYAQVNAGSSLQASLILIKNYGTGGSTQEEVFLTTFTIGSSWQLFAYSWIFGENTSKTIGTLDDDYTQHVLRLPVDSIFDVSFDSFDFAKGQFTNPSMPYTTNAQMIYRSLPGFLPIPNPNGSDLYLQIRLTPTGMEFDKSNIGKIYQCAYSLANIGELICDGSKYEYSAYSSAGIPYYRLGDVLWNSTLNAFQFGTGSSFVTTINIAEHFRLTTNSAGAVSNPSDGTLATGFTFTNIHTGNSAYDFSAYYSSSAVIVTQNVAGAFTASNANTSGFTLVDYINVASVNGVILITGITSVAGLAGKYFTVHNTTQGFYPWFKVDGVGTDPAPGGGLIGIEIDLLSTFSTAELAQSISEALSGKQNFIVSCVAASAIPAGAWFSFNTTSESYYPWYEKDGGGTDPVPPGKVGIKVSIASSDTNVQVALKTSIAINKKYYAVPDLRDMFIRGIDNGRGLDRDVAYRFNLFSNSFGNQIGTIELDEFLSHTHTINPINLFSSVTAPFGTDDIGGGNPAAPLTGALIPSANYSGGKETRPLNIYLNYVIQY